MKAVVLIARSAITLDSLQGLKTAMRDVIVTHKGIFIVGRETEKAGPDKGQAKEVINRHVAWDQLHQVSLSTRQDDFVVLHVTKSYDSLLQIPFKTEFVSIAKKEAKAKTGRDLRIVFADK